MPPIVEFMDLVEGNSAVINNKGKEYTRMAIVTGVDGFAHAKIKAAWEATGLAIHDAHPSDAECVLREVYPESITSTAVKLRLVYRSYTFGFDSSYDTWEVIGSTSQIDVWADKDENPIQLGYEFLSNYRPSPESKTLAELYPNDPSLQSSRVKTGGSVVKMIPELTLRHISRINTSPEAGALTYLGKINEDLWRGYAAKKLLCTGYGGRSIPGTNKWERVIELAHRSETWDPLVVFVDKNYGKPPDDWKTNQGYPTGSGFILPYKQVQVYETVSFAGIPT